MELGFLRDLRSYISVPPQKKNAMNLEAVNMYKAT